MIVWVKLTSLKYANPNLFMWVGLDFAALNQVMVLGLSDLVFKIIFDDFDYLNPFLQNSVLCSSFSSFTPNNSLSLLSLDILP